MKFERRFKKKRKIDMTPLIDVIFQLVVFFMLSTTFVKQQALDVAVAPTSAQASTTPLPKALPKLGDSIDKDEDFTVTIEPNNVYLNSQRMTQKNLADRLSAELDRNPTRKIRIISEKGVNVQRMVDIIDTVRLGGAQNVSIDYRK